MSRVAWGSSRALEMRSGDEVLAVYAALKADERVLWYL